MKTISFPGREKLSEALARPQNNMETVWRQTEKIMQDVARRGDAALRAYTEKFDGVTLKSLKTPLDEIRQAEAQLPPALKEAMQKAFQNIRTFHKADMPRPGRVSTQPGVECWWAYRPIERVGLYIPGGTAPLFSTVLMLSIPARLAGCREIVLCTPPQQSGAVHPAVLYAADLCGIESVYKVGGAQAIAAMASGTASISRVDKIFGPGNSYVFAAKQQAARQGVAIDMPAGPSEVMVLADGDANPVFIAADLLAQAEHSPDAQVIFVTTQSELAAAVNNALNRQLQDLPRRDIAARALENGKMVICRNRAEMLETVNGYAPEHLILNMNDARAFSRQVQHAGSVFIGPYTPEAAGDYASGTNHTLPTAGYARSFSGVSVARFMKRITYQSISRAGLEQLGPVVRAMAEAEALQGHAQSVAVRLNSPAEGR